MSDAQRRNIKLLSYQALPLMLEVRIAGVDVFDSVSDIGSISTSLDYPNLTKYRVGEVPITLSDSDGYYAPNNSDNFFTQQSLPQDGYGASVEIKAGYNTYRTVLFKGRVLKTAQNPVDATVEIVATDSLHKMHTERIADFGLEKQFMVSPSEEESINGVYKIPDWVLPVSDKSMQVSKNVSENLTEVSELADRGNLDSDNFIITNSGIETEGGDIVGTTEGYPQVRYKAPYRHRQVKTLITDLLNTVGVSNLEITLPEIETTDHFSSNGRIGYELAGTTPYGTGTPIGWEGYVTDALYEDGKFYFLTNPSRGDRGTRAGLIQYTQSTQTYEILYLAPQEGLSGFETEFWKIAKNGDYIAILATDSQAGIVTETLVPDIRPSAIGNYDSGETDNKAYIFFRDITQTWSDGATDMTADTTVSIRVAKDSSHPPQLGYKYIFGETHADYRWKQSIGSHVYGQGIPQPLPDSRKSFMFHDGYLYYVYANNLDVGVAKVALTAPAEGVASIAYTAGADRFGLDFDINNDDAANPIINVIGTAKENDRSVLFASEIAL